MNEWRITVLGAALIFAATLFPYDFSFSEFVSLKQSFGLSRTIAQRGNDLLIGADGAFGQPFKGRIDELLIYRRALTPAEIAEAAMMKPPAGDLAAFYSFDEGSGNFVRDASAQTNNGELVNGPEWITGKTGGGLQFNGSSQYVRVPNSPSIDVSGENITISLWVVLEQSPDCRDQAIVAKPWEPASMVYPYYQYGVEFGDRAKTLDFLFADASGKLRGPFSMTPHVGLWTHAAFTYDGKVVRGYLNGREQFSRGLADPSNWRDIALNLLLFVPFGFGLAGLIYKKRCPAPKTILIVLIVGSALSLGVETLQCWLPTRDPSFLDVATNGVSSGIGAVLLILLGERFLACSGRFAFSTRMLVAMWVGYATMALVLSLVLQESSKLDWDEGAALVRGGEPAGLRRWQGRILRMEIASDSVSDNEARQASVVGLTGVGTAPSEVSGDDSVGRPTDAEHISDLIRRLNETNRFTLLVQCSPGDTALGNRAWIIALARDRNNLNFALGQDGTDVVFRLRTPITRKHGMRPQVTAPDVFRNAGSHTILVTYDGSRLRLFVDGTRVKESLRLGPGAAMFSYFQGLRVEEMWGYQVVYYVVVFGPLCWVTVMLVNSAGNPLRKRTCEAQISTL
jgi:VanZ family protein